eukprot:gene35136-45483_t
MGSNNHACYGPFGAARPSYKRGVEGYTDFNTRPALDFLAHLHKTNTTLVIIAFGAYENAEFIVENIQRQKNHSVFIVANIGLWKKDRKNVVVWHETFSQHWIAPSGSG